MNTTKMTYNSALNLLARREHSQLELMQKLLAKGFSKEDIQQVLAKLQENNLQSDTRFAENYIQSRKNHGFGPVRIQMELAQRGVSEEIIKQQIDVSGIDWLDVAQKVLHKKFGDPLPHDFASQIKIKRFLQYKGFKLDK